MPCLVKVRCWWSIATSSERRKAPAKPVKRRAVSLWSMREEDIFFMILRISSIWRGFFRVTFTERVFLMPWMISRTPCSWVGEWSPARRCA